MVFSKEESFGKLFEIMRADNVFEDSGISEDVVKSKSAPQNPKTEKEPELDAEDLDLEDYEDQELNGPDAKGKSKTPENPKYAIRNVSDEETSNPKPKETKESKSGNLYLCNECFKTFRNSKPVCTYCNSSIVESILEKEEIEEMTEKEAEELLGDRATWELRAMKKALAIFPILNTPEDEKRLEAVKILLRKRKTAESKLEKEEIKETVEELIGEVPGIDRHSQDLLRWALKKGTIPNEFPGEEVMIDALSAEDVVPDEETFKSAEPSYIKIYYLKYVLLPRAKKEYLRTEGINPSNNDDIDTKIKKLMEDNKSAIELAYEIVDLISMQSSDGKDRRDEIQERAKRIAIESKRTVLESEFFEDKYGLSNIRAKMIDIMYNMGYSLSEEQKAEEDKTLLTFRKGEDVVEVKVLDKGKE